MGVRCLRSCAVTLLSLSQSFKDSCGKFYKAEMEELDFIHATEESRKHINSWVAKKTEGENSFSVCFLFSVLRMSPRALGIRAWALL